VVRASAGGSTHVLGVGSGPSRVRVAARRSIPFLAPGFRRLRMTRSTMNTFTLPLSGAPGFRRLKMTRSTTNTFNNEHRGALRGTPGSASPQPEPNATELPSSAPGRPKLIKTQSYRPPSLRPRRHAPRNISPRRRVVDLQAAAPSPTPTCRKPRRAEDRAPPRPRPPARAEENYARRRAADLAALQKKTSHVCGTSNGF